MYPTTILDQKTYHTNDFTPFALTDILTEYSKKNNTVFLHFWQYDQTVILGMKDTRTPYLKDGIKELRDLGFVPVVRNSGGLGIISDSGILNISLVFPQNEDAKISIDDAYKKMLTLTKVAFPEADIQAFEVNHSYCPGTYDLSIRGKKFAGIAQRRIKNGISVMMYLSVNGDQQARGSAMKKFYQASLQDDFGTNGYPAVIPESMKTLETLLAASFTVEEVKQRFIHAFNQLYLPGQQFDSNQWKKDHVLTDEWTAQIDRMQERNKIKELAHDYTI